VSPRYILQSKHHQLMTAGMVHVTAGMVHMTAGMVHVTAGMVHVASGMVHVAAGMVRVTNQTPGSECGPTAAARAFAAL
jgi:hypothetical protein